MASFQNMVITTAGLELLQDLILEGGTPLTFSGVGVGDGLLEDCDTTTQTSLVHEVHRLPIEKIEKQEGGHIRVFARLATDIITADFCHRELGVFAKHGKQEILFAYGNAGDDYDFVPATGNNASICKTIVTEFTVGSMKAVFLPLDSSDLVTHSSLNERIEQIKSGDNTWDGKQTFEGAVMCADGLSIPGGKKITLSNGGAIIHANENNSTVHVSSLASSGEVSGNVVNCNRVNSAALAITGTSTFSAGVTMAQSLTVEGQTINKGGLNVGGNFCLYGTDGLPGGTMLGNWQSPDEQDIIVSSGTGQEYMAISYNSASRRASLNLRGNATCLTFPAIEVTSGADFISTPAKSKVMTLRCSDNNSWIDVEARDYGLWLRDQAGNCGNICLYDSTGNTILDNLTTRGPASFYSGVTMAQSLNVAGVATMYRCAVYDAAYSLFSVMTGEAVWQNKSSGTFSLRGDDNGLMGVTLTVGRNDREAARIIKQNQNTSLIQTDVPNLAEGDARWVKFNNTLTAAQYAALAVKDPTTLYITSDTGKIYFGSYALN